MFAMEDVVKMYENLLNQNAAAVIPGTSVPGYGVVADGIGTTNICGIEAVGMQADAVAAIAMGVATNGLEADTVDPKSMQTGIPTSTVIPDGMDSKAKIIGENTDRILMVYKDSDNYSSMVEEFSL